MNLMSSISNSLHHTLSKKILLLGALSIFIMTATSTANAQADYPNKPLTIIVPFAVGGTTDVLARTVGQALSVELGQPVLIDNRAGAGGNVGAALAAKAPADGYTLFMGTVGTHGINASLYKKLPYDPIKDFTPLTRVANVPNVLVANPAQPFKSVPELIAYAKANPGKVYYASAGNGSSIHLSGALFGSMADVDIVHVPYKGSAPAMNDLLGNQVGIMFDNLPSAIPHIRSGKLRPLAVTTSKRSQEIPNTPTIAESGVPGYEATSWFGLFVPAGTPPATVKRLHSAIAKVLAQNDVKQRISSLGGEVVIEKPEQFSSFIQAETIKWGKVVRDSGASVD
jgi:tripartite-type tricarboxylate transporter receptor subunit TctC